MGTHVPFVSRWLAFLFFFCKHTSLQFFFWYSPINCQEITFNLDNDATRNIETSTHAYFDISFEKFNQAPFHSIVTSFA